MITRRISFLPEAKGLAELIQKADVQFTNCEILFHNLQSYPTLKEILNWPFVTMSFAEPPLARELQFFGFNLAALSNNHTMDYGPEGMFSTIRTLNDVGIVCAGSGGDLDEAREPKYIETENGRVALVSMCWSPFQIFLESAANSKAGVPARPGVNYLLVDSVHFVDKPLFKALQKVIEVAGLSPPDGFEKRLGQGELSFLGHRFKIGETSGTVRQVRKEDWDANMKSIADAKKSADWVLVSLHTHDSDARGLEYPARWVQDLAHSSIEAGADVFLGHGPHVLQGIEIYHRRPIFYSLGNFIVQNLTVKKVTADQYRILNLGRDAVPSDFHDIRRGQIPPSGMPYADWWFDGVIPLFQLDKEGLTSLRLNPISMRQREERDAKRIHVGVPHLATREESKKTLGLLSTTSKQWGTEISMDKKESFGWIKIPS